MGEFGGAFLAQADQFEQRAVDRRAVAASRDARVLPGHGHRGLDSCFGNKRAAADQDFLATLAAHLKRCPRHGPVPGLADDRLWRTLLRVGLISFGPAAFMRDL